MNMKKSVWIVAMTVMAMSLVSAAETADSIIAKVDAYQSPKDQTSTMQMLLVDAKGQTRERSMKLLRIGTEKQLLWFIAPADVKGSSFLTISHKDRDDDQWMFLPAFGKVRRIASSAKKGNFMGSDFSYADWEKRKLNDYTYQILKEDTIDTKKCWVVQITPKTDVDTDYSKINTWICKENLQEIKLEKYTKKGDLQKIATIEYTYMKNYWIVNKITMSNVIESHKTVVTFDQIDVNTGISEDLFTTASMTKIR